MHQFVQAGMAVYNPDRPDRPVNSPKACYQVEAEVLELVRLHGTDEWMSALRGYSHVRESLVAQYAKERDMQMIPVQISDGTDLQLTPGAHSELIKGIIEEFGPRFVPAGRVVYVGDTGDKFGVFDDALLGRLGVKVDSHGKMPDVVLFDEKNNWLFLVEAVTSHGPVDAKRHRELAELFAESSAGLVFVTAFPTRALMAKYLDTISWETEVWVLNSPSHLIHFDGERFLGPYQGQT